MEFNNNQPIYLQIINEITNKIIKNEYSSEDRMPSIRDLAKHYKVNQNTVMKSMKELELSNILENKRGIGYFVTNDTNLIKELKKNKVKEAIKKFLDDMRTAGFNKEEILEIIEKEG